MRDCLSLCLHADFEDDLVFSLQKFGMRRFPQQRRLVTNALDDLLGTLYIQEADVLRRLLGGMGLHVLMVEKSTTFFLW
jgi:hypothetical protein